jgi:NO-binding membrane sensor protein with MHYT domain
VIGRFRGLVELALAGAALVGAGLSWAHASHTIAVAPIADGQPATTSLVYDPQLLLLTLVLATTAGVLAVVGTARLRRARALSSPGPNADGLT